jgi:hypothetical protein
MVVPLAKVRRTIDPTPNPPAAKTGNWECYPMNLNPLVEYLVPHYQTTKLIDSETCNQMYRQLRGPVINQVWVQTWEKIDEAIDGFSNKP